MNSQILLASLLAGLATGLGGAIVVIFGRPGKTLLAIILGLAAGINIAVATFELLPEAIEIGGLTYTLLGFVIGLGLMFIADLFFPHLDLNISKELGSNGQNQLKMLRIGLLFALGIAIHNMPEGMAIGAGFESAPRLGIILAVVIGLHNIPEGMGSAAPLKVAGIGAGMILLITTLSGLFTPLGALLGILLINWLSGWFVAVALALGAGAIVYVASKEIIPASYEQHQHFATLGIALGYILTILLLF